MKAKLLAGASLGALALATGANAADLSRPAPAPVYKAPAVIAPVWTWTGFYLGGNVGAVFGHSSIADDPSTSLTWLGGNTFTNNSTGVIGGAQAGYNWQMSNVVLGIEADISGSSLNHSVFIAGGSDTYSSRLSWLSTVRGRLGFAVDRALIYGTGGVAFAGLKDEIVDPPTNIGFSAATGSTVTGWTAGGGIEYALADHWTVKAEYLHVGLPDRTATVVSAGATNGYAFRFKDQLDIGRVGFNYKF